MFKAKAKRSANNSKKTAESQLNNIKSYANLAFSLSSMEMTNFKRKTNQATILLIVTLSTFSI